MRILIAELKQETATFNPTLTRYDDFHIAVGDELFTTFRGTQTELAGAIDVFEAQPGLQIVPTMAAASVSGGRIGASDLDRLLAELVDSVRANRDVDGAYLC